MDREKVINGLRSIKTYFASQAIETTNDFAKLAFYESQKDIDDAIAMLKEQEMKPLRCKTCTMRDKTGFCHRWNIEVKEDDYCSFGAWKGR